MDKIMIRQNAFKVGWKKLDTKIEKPSLEYKKLRDWQIKAHSQLISENNCILNAPTGSGKSLLMCAISANKMKLDKKLRTIIAVPQTIIGAGFAYDKFELVTGEKINWCSDNNLCEKYDNNANIPQVIKFLEGPNADKDLFFNDRILICTHRTLVMAFEELKKQNRLDLWDDLILWIDEAHHIKNVLCEDYDEIVSNCIGEFVDFILKKNGNIHLGLSTASFFRGDKYTIITKKMESEFARFNLPYDEYLGSLEHLESFSLDFVLCGKNWIDGVESVLKERTGKTICYIPHPMSNNSTGDKYREASKIQEIHEKYGGSNLKIINLVDENKREEKKNYITKVKSKEDLDGIITVGMFKEGANWIWADQSIIVGFRSSLVEMLQIIGRLLRDAKDKKHVEVIVLLPFALDQTDKDEFREKLNNYVKAIYLCLILENVINPITELVERKVEGSNGETKIERVNWLCELIPNESDQISLMVEVKDVLLSICSTESDKSWYERYSEEIESVIKNYGVTENLEELKRQIWKMHVRKSVCDKGLDVSEIDFYIVKEANPLDFLIRYTTNSCGVDTFEKLRELIKCKPKSIEEYVVIAEELAFENGGLLPSYTWLEKHGHENLAAMLNSRPEKFDHIKREYLLKDLNEAILTATKLANENNGILPSQRWLKDNGFKWLAHSIEKYREKFDFVQEKERTTLGEAIEYAEKLAKDNGGLLPSGLQGKKLAWLYAQIKNYPDKFAHISKEKVLRNINDANKAAKELFERFGKIPNHKWLKDNDLTWLSAWLIKLPNNFEKFGYKINISIKGKIHRTFEEKESIVKKLIDDNNGVVPSNKWLNTKGYRWVDSHIRNGSKYKLCKKDKEFKTVDEWVTEAELLAKNNDGILPALKRPHMLNHHIKKYPEKFAHLTIEPKRKIKSVDEWVLKAEQLAENNGGILPSGLSGKGLNGLYKRIKKHPNKFAHILKNKCKKSVDEWVLEAEKLASENNGVLPPIAWLRKNNLYGLSLAIWKHPNKFVHIPKEKLK